MHEWYEPSLPSGYAPVRVIDVKNKRTALLLNFAALGVMVLFGVLGVILLPLRGFWAAFEFFHYGIFLAALLLYIVLHELLHGLAYFLMTRQRLTFGLTLSAAFCGVPNIYVYRKTALIALLTPFAVFLPIFAAPVFLLQNPFDRFACLCLLAMHLGMTRCCFCFVIGTKRCSCGTRGPRRRFIRCNKEVRFGGEYS